MKCCKQWETFPLEIEEQETIEYFGNSSNNECTADDIRKIMFSNPNTQISKYICGVLNSFDGKHMLIYGATPLSGRVQGILVDEPDRFKLIREIRVALNSISKYHPAFVSVSTIDVEARKNSIMYFEKNGTPSRLVVIKICIRNPDSGEFYTVNDVYYTITCGKPSVMTPEQIQKKYIRSKEEQEENTQGLPWTSCNRDTYSTISQCKALLSPRYLKQ